MRNATQDSQNDHWAVTSQISIQPALNSVTLHSVDRQVTQLHRIPNGGDLSAIPRQSPAGSWHGLGQDSIQAGPEPTHLISVLVCEKKQRLGAVREVSSIYQ